MEEYYTLSEVAKMLKLSERSIHNYLRAGVLQGARYGHEWRFSESQIKALHEYGTKKAREMMAAEREARQKKQSVAQHASETSSFTELSSASAQRDENQDGLETVLSGSTHSVNTDGT